MNITRVTCSRTWHEAKIEGSCARVYGLEFDPKDTPKMVHNVYTSHKRCILSGRVMWQCHHEHPPWHNAWGGGKLGNWECLRWQQKNQLFVTLHDNIIFNFFVHYTLTIPKPPLWMFWPFCDKNDGNLSYLHACSCGTNALRKQMNKQVYWCEEFVLQNNMLAILQTCFQPLCYIRTLLCIARFWPFLINLIYIFPGVHFKCPSIFGIWIGATPSLYSPLLRFCKQVLCIWIILALIWWPSPKFHKFWHIYCMSSINHQTLWTLLYKGHSWLDPPLCLHGCMSLLLDIDHMALWPYQLDT